jgi:hypothetical protein
MNLEARVHAIGWSGLHAAFGGKGEYAELLPFPDLIHERSQKESLSPATIAIVKRLIRLSKIPDHILSAIAQTSDVIADFIYKG